ncbi:MAG: tRNA epoxyqueuosine(34) reductase QueG [Woeseiaceae bacterium]|jgi:epoxyqueuosine reductase|nr:tRNA epoxyqueuosine(34) reductase QueG [Woeseiaceae bacterium]MBT7275214.1 tRNA epoxyqueuosine(34) reductase QueG [Woeseiaceae bacterium]MDG1015281.1 tRNA epoxyqueuosine(34) reductase QueG [Woeseiaceae bacterium]MDG1712610.1 tRNA epoxyqueuosine(34) reductase QueG [Woeseiaceae bacterium]MDG1866092.1 tRNA epoxyqueuosine(34) reductase QueG [Woeseiaceae bacterium]
MNKINTINKPKLIRNINLWGAELGFQQIGFSDINLKNAEKKLKKWLDMKFHGEMHYMEKHGLKRSRPDLLLPNTLSVISARMNYLATDNESAKLLLDHKKKAYISRYTLGRDYHKVLRQRLKKLAHKIDIHVKEFGYRVFVDSAPVLEKPLASKAGLGWIGKHTNLINKDNGSWFFLGEIYTNIKLPNSNSSKDHCGTCFKCIDVCPTKAIIAPYILDARRCISYLTIELKGSIPIEYRRLIGNRIFGCDDCQIFCPWNKFASKTEIKDFDTRHALDTLDLIDAFLWTEEIWLKKTEGSAIRRIGFEQWIRNVAIAMGNAKTNKKIIEALNSRKNSESELIREHVNWALDQHS